MFLPRRFRSGEEPLPEGRPSWTNRKTTSALLTLSQQAANFPVYIILGAAVLASTTYLGLVESGLFERQTLSSAAGRADVHDLLAGSKNLYIGAETSWKWSEDHSRYHDADEVCLTNACA